MRLDKIGLDQIRLDQVRDQIRLRLDQIGLDQLRLGQIRLCRQDQIIYIDQIRLDLDQIGSDQTGLAVDRIRLYRLQIRFGPDWIRLDQVRLDQIRQTDRQILAVSDSLMQFLHDMLDLIPAACLQAAKCPPSQSRRRPSDKLLPKSRTKSGRCACTFSTWEPNK